MSKKNNTSTRIKTARDLHEDMDWLIEGIKEKTLQREDAQEINKAATNKIRLAATELAYAKYRNSSTGGSEIQSLES